MYAHRDSSIPPCLTVGQSRTEQNRSRPGFFSLLYTPTRDTTRHGTLRVIHIREVSTMDRTWEATRSEEDREERERERVHAADAVRPAVLEPCLEVGAVGRPPEMVGTLRVLAPIEDELCIFLVQIHGERIGDRGFFSSKGDEIISDIGSTGVICVEVRV